MTRRNLRFSAAPSWWTMIVLLAAPLAQGEITPENEKFFESRIRPVLADACYECHSKSAGKSKGGLILDTASGLRQGGNSGPAVDASGSLEDSWLWIAISHEDRDLAMPPKSERLPQDVLADFRRWIEMGAPDPRRDDAPHQVLSEIDVAAVRAAHWAFQSPVHQEPPAVVDPEWSGSPIDRFVASARRTQRLPASPPAEPNDLARRLAFDLIGLPPTPEAAAHFVEAYRAAPETAVVQFVDRLLSTPQFGERWGRHWLDVARYAESNGKETNFTYPQAWRYRDYVVDAFHSDTPFNDFLRQQIAGDLLPSETEEARQRNLVATGFLSLGPKNLKEENRRQFIADLVDEQIDTTFLATQGLTVSCARCHDHKIDPIPTADYYALAGIFQSTETLFGAIGAKRNSTRLLTLPVRDPAPETISGAGIEELQTELARLHEQARTLRTQKGEGERVRLSPIRDRIKILAARLESVGEGGVIETLGIMTQDSAEPADAALLVRGEIDTPAQIIPRGFLQVLGHSTETIPKGQSGRRQLADWIVSPQNPLTARVYVNRVWQQLFGRGLVTTPNNFGVGGHPPSHPELLDHLAISFVESGWSVKTLLREIVLSRTYRQASALQSRAHATDPDNVFLWRQTPRRLDAEALRDAILAVSGRIDYARPWGSAIADLGPIEMGRRGSPELDTTTPVYRSVYLPIVRDRLPEILDLFDAPDTNSPAAARETSNVPTQSLYLLNDPFLLDSADAMAKRIELTTSEPAVQITEAFHLAFTRPPSAAEKTAAVEFFLNFPHVDEGLALSTFCQSLLVSAEFRYLR